jgi:Big-like domain-containing protein
MPYTTTRSMRRAVLLLAASALGCSSDILLPEAPDGGQNVALTKVTGDEQVGTVGEPLLEPLVVQVLTERELPAVGRKVAFILTADPSAGQVDPDTAVTDDQGRATARWVLGTAPGAHLVVAQLVGGEAANQVAEFRAAAKAAAPDTFSAASPLTQPGRRGREVESAPMVRVVDRYGNPVENISVVWQVTAGEGDVNQPVTQTDDNGQATAQWILGNRIGVQRLTATLEAGGRSPVTFSATVLF